MTQHDDDPFAPKTESGLKPETVHVKKSDNPLSSDALLAAQNDKVVVTLKGGAGYDAPWIVIHAADVQDAHNHFVGDNSKLLVDLMSRVQTASKEFVGRAPAREVVNAAAPAPTSNVPAGAQSAPNNETRQCKHGAMTYKTGSKGGRTWKAFMCPTPKGAPDQCEPQWIRD